MRVIRSLGVEVVPFDLPEVAIEAIDFIRYAETAAAFDDLTRSGRLRDVEHGPEQSPRPAEIRPARFIPAVEYIQANRYRMRVMEQMDAAMSGLDLFIGANLLLTNRTGHPVISLPSGFFEGSPTAPADDRQAVRRAGAAPAGARVPVKDRSSPEASVALTRCPTS